MMAQSSGFNASASSEVSVVFSSTAMSMLTTSGMTGTPTGPKSAQSLSSSGERSKPILIGTFGQIETALRSSRLKDEARD